MMTAIPVDASSRRPLGASMMLLGLAIALVVVDAATTVLNGGGSLGPLSLAVYLLSLVMMTVAGAVVLRNRAHAGLGRLLLGAAAAAAFLDLAGWLYEVAPFGFLQNVVYWVYAGLLTHLLVRWPDDRIGGRVARALVIVMYAVMPLVTVVWQLTWVPRWFGADFRSTWWITLLPARDFSAGMWQVQQIVLVALIVALAVVVVTRAAAAHGARRAAMAPVTVASLALAAAVVLGILQSLGIAIRLDSSLVQNIASLAVPVAVLLATVRTPAGLDEPTAPGRRLHVDDPTRERYHLGFAALGAAVVVVAAVAIVYGADGWSDTPVTGPAPAPQPGPALVAP